MLSNPTTPDHADRLIVESNMADPDGFYERLLELHQGLDEQQSAQLNARLVLVLANHIGSATVLEEAFALARRHL